MAKEINSGGTGDVSYITIVGDNFFFRANDGSSGEELYGSVIVSTTSFS